MTIDEIITRIQPDTEREKIKREVEELKSLFLHFLRKSSDDYCKECAYCEPTRCAKGAWWLNADGNFEDSDQMQARDYCIDGLIKFFENQEGNDDV